jgi:myosin-1
MVVVSDFAADNESSISVHTGEFVWVDEKSDTGWWFAKKRDGSEGWAPSDYLKPAAGVAKPKPAAKPAISAKP